MFALEIVCRDISAEEIVQHLLPIIQHLGNEDWFTPRLAATSMIPLATQKLTDNLLMDTLLLVFFFPFFLTFSFLKLTPPPPTKRLFTKLCDDATPMVRREAQTQIAKLAQTVPKEPFLKLVAPKFVSLAKDSQDSVRLLSVLNAIEIAKMLNDEECVAFNILETLLECANDEAWRVRFMVAENLSEVFFFFCFFFLFLVLLL